MARFHGDQNGEKEKVIKWTGFVREDIINVCVLFHSHAFLKCLFIELPRVSVAACGAFHCSRLPSLQCRSSGPWDQWLQCSSLAALQHMGP